MMLSLFHFYVPQPLFHRDADFNGIYSFPDFEKEFVIQIPVLQILLFQDATTCRKKHDNRYEITEDNPYFGSFIPPPPPGAKKKAPDGAL